MPDTFDPTTGEIAAFAMPTCIARAIIAVKKKVKTLGSDERNEHGRYTYVSVDKFYQIIGQLMADAGIALMIDEIEGDVRVAERTDERGNTKTTPWLFTKYRLAFVHETGAMSAPVQRSCALPISGPQAFGAAQSYIEKQFLRQVFKVPTGDRDADDTAPSEDAPGRAPPRQHYQRPQAAEPTPDRSRALAEWKRMRDEIDQCVTIPEVDGLLGSPAFADLRKLSEKVSPEAAGAVDQLVARAETHKANLMGGPGAAPF